jgi:hypothetical protein
LAKIFTTTKSVQTADASIFYLETKAKVSVCLLLRRDRGTLQASLEKINRGSLKTWTRLFILTISTFTYLHLI